MKFKKSLVTLFTASLFLPFLGYGEDVSTDRHVQVIDTPTAEVIDHYGYQLDFRFGREGALQAKTQFGIFKRLNLGFSLDGENVIGTGPSRLNKPAMNVKFRLFDGKAWIPAFALGFDGQGTVYNKETGEYEQKETGFYAVMSQEIILPSMMLNVGVNRERFDKGGTTHGFAGLSYTYQRLLGVMAEYVNFDHYDEGRINFGLKYYITPLFTVDGIGRNVPKVDATSGREWERIVRLTYKGAF